VFQDAEMELALEQQEKASHHLIAALYRTALYCAVLFCAGLYWRRRMCSRTQRWSWL